MGLSFTDYVFGGIIITAWYAYITGQMLPWVETKLSGIIPMTIMAIIFINVVIVSIIFFFER